MGLLNYWKSYIIKPLNRLYKDIKSFFLFSHIKSLLRIYMCSRNSLSYIYWEKKKGGELFMFCLWESNSCKSINKAPLAEYNAQCTMHSAQCTNRHENNSKTRNQTHDKGSCSLRMGKGDKGQLPPGRNEQNNKTVISSLFRGIYGI